MGKNIKSCSNCIHNIVCAVSMAIKQLAFGSRKVTLIKGRDDDGSNEKIGQVFDVPIQVRNEDGTCRDRTEKELLEDTPESICQGLYRGQAADCDNYKEKGVVL